MASVLPPRRDIEYPDSDGQPMAETPQHRDNMINTIVALKLWFAADPMVYVSGNMFVYYAEGDRHQHVSPDVFAVRGIPKLPERRSYRVWEEGKAPEMVIEFTSESTRGEDIEDKFWIYREKLKVSEYFLFDPFEEYLEPSLQGHRLVRGQWVPIKPVRGRVPSKVLGLHLERSGEDLRLYDPGTGSWLPFAEEEHELRERAEAELRQAEEARRQAEGELQRAEEARKQAEGRAHQAATEIERLRRELEELQRTRTREPQPRPPRRKNRDA
jgi:Uma2 family endonuclease